MRLRYIATILVLLALAAAFEGSVIWGPLAAFPRLPQALQGAAVFVALIAATIAVHASDKKPRRVKATVELSIDPRESKVHSRAEIHPSILAKISHKADTFRSDRVQVSIHNTSGFTLKQPAITFRLPVARQHPHRLPDGNWVVTFNSNLYNSQRDLRILEFGDTAIISNSNLPYWNEDEEVVIWVRMVLDQPDDHPFEIAVSINADNAEGSTTRLKVDPAVLIAAPLINDPEQ